MLCTYGVRTCVSSTFVAWNFLNVICRCLSLSLVLSLSCFLSKFLFINVIASNGLMMVREHWVHWTDSFRISEERSFENEEPKTWFFCTKLYLFPWQCEWQWNEEKTTTAAKKVKSSFKYCFSSFRRQFGQHSAECRSCTVKRSK